MEKEATIHEQLDAATRRARTIFLLGAFASFCFSVGLWFSGWREEGLFVGLWVPSILSLGALVVPSMERAS
jgi:hypothetical protein